MPGSESSSRTACINRGTTIFQRRSGTISPIFARSRIMLRMRCWPNATSRSHARCCKLFWQSAELLVAQRFDRQQPGGLARRIETEKYPDCRGEAHREHHRCGRQAGAPARELPDGERAAEAERNAEQAADQGQRDRFDQEILE